TDVSGCFRPRWCVGLMNFYKIRTTEIRVGVLGLYASGKTVFLTSLLNHLIDHDRDRFRLGNGTVTVRKFQEQPTDLGWPRFDYEANRDAFVHQRWPRKTRDRAEFVCTFERSDWWISDARLRFYDLPGERIADAVMVARDYAGWSDHVLKLFRDDTEYRSCCTDFLKVID